MAAYELGKPVQTRRFRVRHTTQYAYDRLIERSAHRLHLRPIHDWKQRVVDYKLTVTPDAQGLEYEDPFGNWTTRYDVAAAYNQMTILAESTVELSDVDPFAFANLPVRPTFPLSWMPWDHKMLSPYLTPEELPETQLTEIYDYAMSFVERNKGDLMETLFDVNLTLFREFVYAPGSTNILTTPYDVLANKRGVCQDFANLFITMARLLGLPARYVCGYVYTGNVSKGSIDEKLQSPGDATHGWVQLFIPNVGWKGFDPTNGKLPSTDHVRLAVGRHYRDTAPVTGTLYTTAIETMTTTVELADLDMQAPPQSPASQPPANQSPQQTATQPAPTSGAPVADLTAVAKP
jgi:transglutaminase-like putative cysteine protease